MTLLRLNKKVKKDLQDALEVSEVKAATANLKNRNSNIESYMLSDYKAQNLVLYNKDANYSYDSTTKVLSTGRNDGNTASYILTSFIMNLNYASIKNKYGMVTIKNTGTSELDMSQIIVLLSNTADWGPSSTKVYLSNLLPSSIDVGKTVCIFIDYAAYPQYDGKSVRLVLGSQTQMLYSVDISFYLRDKEVVDTVVCWGDSLTLGVPVYGELAYPGKLQTLLPNFNVLNFGVGGESSRTIASRQGGLPMIAQPSFTIPAAATPVQITLKSSDGGTIAPCLQTTNDHWAINPCTISGISGSLSYSDNKYYFTRTNAGTATIINRPTPIITNAMTIYRNSPVVIWMGQNTGYTGEAELVSQYKLMVDYLTSANKKYICIGLHSGDATTRATLEAAMASAFGRHYINLREYMVNYGLADAGITATTADTTAIAAGSCPPSLLSDTVHGTAAFYDIVSKLVYARGKELGYWD